MANYVLDELLLKTTISMDAFKGYKSELLDKIKEAGEYGYAIYKNEIIHFLNLHLEDKDKTYFPRPVDGFVDFISDMHLHGVPLKDRNAMVATVLQRYQDSLQTI